MTKKQPLRQRISRNVEITADGCWLWSLYCDRDGYGHLGVDGVLRLAHRVSYEAFVGSIPDGLEIDHLCRRRSCVNPEHLEPVTHQVNMSRRPSQPRAVCSNGHVQDPATRREIRRPNGEIHRACRKCEAAASRRYKARKQQNQKESNS